MKHTEKNMHHSRSADAGSGRTVHSIYRAVALVTALALLLTAGFTALAGGNALAESAAAPALPEQPSSGLPETVHAKIMEFNPDIADKLVPLNLSSEKQGIRVDLLSALVQGNEAWLVYAFQAPKDSPVDISSIGVFEFNNRFDLAYRTVRSEQISLGYDKDANRVTRLLHIQYDEPVKPEDRTVNLDLSDLQVIESTDIDLLPYLKEYGTEQEGIDPPAFLPRYYPDENGGVIEKTPEADKVLDYTHPLGIPLYKTFTLTGIGWIDGKLHVQIHNPENGRINIGGSNYPVWLLNSISNYIPGHSKELDAESLRWSDTPDSTVSNWYELVSSAVPEDVDRMVLSLHLREIVDVIPEAWEFRVPLLSILDSGSETADSAPADSSPIPAESTEETAKSAESTEETAKSAESPEETAEPAGALDETVSRALNSRFPGLADKLKPVNLSCVKNGIRAEILSALVEDNQCYTLYSLQDLKGGRFQYLNNDSAYLRDSFGNYSSYNTAEIYRDEAEQKIFFLRRTKYNTITSTATDSCNISIGYILVTDHWFEELEPYLLEHRDSAVGITPPENCLYDYGSVVDPGDREVKVLDYTNPLNIPINKEGNLLLTGIGWIDGQLQVQIHNTADQDRQYEKFGSYPVWNCHVGGYSYKNGKYMHTDLSPVVWNDPNEPWNVWRNYIFDISPDEIGKMSLYAEISHYLDVITGSWDFDFPFASILAD